MRKTIGTLLLAISLMGLGAPAMASPRGETTLRLEGLGMDMSAKQLRRLRTAVRRVRGVRWAKVDLATGELFVGHHRGLSNQQLERAVRRVGFAPVTPTVHAHVDTTSRPKS